MTKINRKNELKRTMGLAWTIRKVEGLKVISILHEYFSSLYDNELTFNLIMTNRNMTTNKVVVEVEKQLDHMAMIRELKRELEILKKKNTYEPRIHS